VAGVTGRLSRVHLSRLSLRGRLTLIATVVIGVGVILGSMLLNLALDRALIAEVQDSAKARARDVAALLEEGSLPQELPRAGGTAAEQVLDSHGGVLAGTPGREEGVALLRGAALDRARHGRPVTVDGSVIGHGGELRVVGRAAGPGGSSTVLVASSLAPIERTEQVVREVLLLLCPLVLVGVSGVCWYVVGSALRPVDALRRGAQDITGSQSPERLPVPHTQDELRRLAETLNDMLDRLAGASARQRVFVSDAAHELRSPLTSIKTQLEVTRAHPHTAAWEDTADDVMSEVDRLSRLVDDLLMLARRDEPGSSQRRHGPVDLGEVADAVGLRYPGIVARSGASGVIVEGDADELTRVVDNLVANALRHTRSDVLVDVRRADANATLTVTDDGPGIPEAERERVFERFTRLDEARSRDAGGSGLGLAIVREIVTAHGGTVDLQDAGPGLRVVVRLPAAGPVAPREQQPGDARRRRSQQRA
jgi:signal transduction histidine kinase